ncbi:unnamed protein product [Diabrotica balteata]|uniref:Cathepsin propeptide inhibitor domain-containing protein n=1 Tax=Diabrotica balteata TaxID=107213 RepID=A0A9N9TF49_DIABA|nr:unnamed protein product [Diabrotica balteata]
MFKYLFLIFAVYVVTAVIVNTDEEKCDKYKQKYYKQYESPEVEPKRFETFQENLRRLEECLKQYEGVNGIEYTIKQIDDEINAFYTKKPERRSHK